MKKKTKKQCKHKEIISSTYVVANVPLKITKWCVFCGKKLLETELEK